MAWLRLPVNSFVRASAWWVFFREISLSIKPTFAASTMGYPIVVSVLIAICAVVGLVEERKTSGLRVSMAGSMYVWCGLVLLVTHRTPFFRVWLFLVRARCITRWPWHDAHRVAPPGHSAARLPHTMAGSLSRWPLHSRLSSC
jgi:hypothetical protein